MNKTGLSASEEKVMDSLIEAWNGFIKLPIQHPSEKKEFEHHTHILQGLLAIRSTRRDHPKGWFNSEEK